MSKPRRRSRYRLSFSNKYELWSAMVRGETDRVFVPSSARPVLTTKVPIEVSTPELKLPLVLEALVVGRRPKSRRFEAGAFVRFEPAEVDKCRRFLALEQRPERYLTGRKQRRVPLETRVQMIEPALEETFLTKDISAAGLSLHCKEPLHVGQRVKISLHLGVTPVEVETEVAWYSMDINRAGLRFIDPCNAVLAAVDELLDRQGRAEPAADRVVVVADDDPAILRCVTVALEKHGYEIVKATDGEMALQAIRSRLPDLVLLDVLMPGIDGVDICKMMRADEQLADIPVVLLSALHEHELARVAAEAGASDYLSKPVALADLINLAGLYMKDVTPAAA